jgi:hypothetical protein|eukprot:CAMPEP_0113545634 /NCGR_PEP_ID=MMETSP0015_2-20120614/11369_1 /TAXON_ID=2838 /ORGANISM="Odontella" /LENGTH=301 /DNA_ID=CAMNT_0000446019 /DNA_START=330 /DNA_END=1235 /DNA_ORIENTATION=+ /assembly_acc=CAM_ASM_000160
MNLNDQTNNLNLCELSAIVKEVQKEQQMNTKKIIFGIAICALISPAALAVSSVTWARSRQAENSTVEIEGKSAISSVRGVEGNVQPAPLKAERALSRITNGSVAPALSHVARAFKEKLLRWKRLSSSSPASGRKLFGCMGGCDIDESDSDSDIDATLEELNFPWDDEDDFRDNYCDRSEIELDLDYEEFERIRDEFFFAGDDDGDYKTSVTLRFEDTSEDVLYHKILRVSEGFYLKASDDAIVFFLEPTYHCGDLGDLDDLVDCEGYQPVYILAPCSDDDDDYCVITCDFGEATENLEAWE